MVSSLRYCQMCGAANQLNDEICFACTRPLKQDVGQDGSSGLLRERYQILSQVGTGGFGAVYKSLDMLSQRRVVAIKQINLRGLTSQESIEATDAFNREVLLLSNLAHPHLPRIHDHFTDADHWYLVMDFIAGQTLEQYLHDSLPGQTAMRSLPLDEVLEYALQLCDVLDYLHTRQPPIIFRDLKPSNVMRTTQGPLYLIDFGIARHFKPGKPKDTMPFGSPGYAAPEQYGKAQTTPRADIYSLGALLHHLLSRTDPAETPFSFAPLRLYGLAGLTELEELISRMVQMDASKRPADMGEVAAQLREIVVLREKAEPRIWRPPVGLNPPDPATLGDYQSWRSAAFGTGGQQQILQQQQAAAPSPGTGKSSRRKFVALAGGATMMIGVQVLLHSLASSPHSMSYAPIYRSRAAILGFEPAGTLTEHASQVNGVVWSPNSPLLASVSQEGRVVVWNIGGDRSMGIVGYTLIRAFDEAGAGTAISWSPAGRYLAVGAGNQVQIVDTSTWKSLPPYQDVAAVNTVVWSPDGRYLAVGGSRTTAAIIQVSDGQIKPISEIHEANQPWKQDDPWQWITWSPDGTRMALVSPDFTIEVVSATADAEQRTLFTYREHTSSITAVAWSPGGSLIASADVGGSVRIWSPTTGQGWEAQSLSTENGPVSALAWSSRSTVLAGATQDGPYLWPLRGGEVRLIYPPGARVAGRSIAWSYDNMFLAAGNADGSVRLWRNHLRG